MPPPLSDDSAGVRNPKAAESPRHDQEMTRTELWKNVDALIDRAPSISALQAHRIHLLAAARWRARGREIPGELLPAERHGALGTILAPVVLERVRDVLDEPVLLLKGPEVAARYPDPASRGFIDLDLLVDDVESAQAKLLERGFAPAPNPQWAFRRGGDEELFAPMHHERPLFAPDLPLKFELHRRPSWPRWLQPPRAQELFEVTVPSQVAEGVVTLSPAAHTIILAAHSWVHTPLGRIRDLIDIVLMSSEADAAELEAIAERWGVARLWKATSAVADSLLLGAHRPLSERTWARNVTTVRERTVFENHLENWISCYWTLPPRDATARAARNIAWTFRPAADEPWSRKLIRAARAARNALTPKSVHDSQLGEEARQLHPPEKWD
jgi:Uncharacterised nucleotidyltransferase